MPEVAGGRKAILHGYLGIVLISAVINLFMLSGSIFMLQVYDRVLPSNSVPTLIALSVIVSVIYVILGLLETIRLRAATRVGEWLDGELGLPLARQTIRKPLVNVAGNQSSVSARPLQDLDRVRSFIGSGGAIALCDLPWVPIYLAVAFLFHPDLGVLATGGVVGMMCLALVSDRLAQKPARAASAASASRLSWIESGIRNSEAIAGLGMTDAFSRIYSKHNGALQTALRRAADLNAIFTGLSRASRLMLQSGSLALGAYLALDNEITAGMIIAVSIIASRATGPVDQAIVHWRSLVAARQSWARLKANLAQESNLDGKLSLPRPRDRLSISGVYVASPNATRVLVADISFTLNAGSALGVIGPSGSGKSSLARALVGVWPTARGSIRLDGADLTQWDPASVGKFFGYLPQNTELLDGTIAQNISRFDETASLGDVMEAAQLAGVHDLITKLPGGYATIVGAGGTTLSGGQQQRVGLARALFGAPFLIVLDEPSSNLDAEGDEALARATQQMKARGTIVIIIAHKPSSIMACDHVLVLDGGRQVSFGPLSTIVNRPAAGPIRIAV